MGAPEDEHIFGVQLRESANDGSDFTNADADYRKLFLGEDGSLHLKDSAGTVTDLGGTIASLDDVGDVNAPSPSNGDVLTWDSTPGEWVSAAPSGGGGPENWFVSIPLFSGGHANTNWDTFQADGAKIYGGDWESDGNQNDEIGFDIGMSGGTWDIKIIHHQGPNRGIYHVQVDGSDVGTIDGYNAGTPKNVLGVVSGVSISSGKRRISLQMSTKNASSSAYFGTVGEIALYRTA